jgi:hypothetical protein
MYSYSKMDTDTEPKPTSKYNREKYEQNKEKIVSEFGVFNVIILARRVCNTNLPITHQTLSILSNQNTLCLLLRNIQHTHSPSQSLLILSVYVCIYTYFTEREREREKKGSREIWNCSFTNTHADTLRNNPRIIQISEREDRMRERDTHTRHWYQDFPLCALIRTLSSTLSHHTKTKETASVCVCVLFIKQIRYNTQTQVSKVIYKLKCAIKHTYSSAV